MEEEIEITTTHLYIRFKPKDEEELTLLQKDTTLLLFDHPLDYEITEEGDFYQDPEISEERPIIIISKTSKACEDLLKIVFGKHD